MVTYVSNVCAKFKLYVEMWCGFLQLIFLIVK
jgi:hypothetical protein